jgi:CubicO group peptidase (beta-lactamase class C family)
LLDRTVGFAVRLWQPDGVGLTYWAGDAQRPGEGDRRWHSDVRMHVASVSKLVTAMAMTRLLDDYGISPDAPILPYLPHYWGRGADVDKVTFAHLMNHTSGFFNPGDDDSSYGVLKAQIARGMFLIGQYRYQNTNFSMLRVLLATINGDVPANTWLAGQSEDDNDSLWEHLTIEAYRRYLNDVVLGPSGVVGPTLTHPGDGALAYTFPPVAAGWNSGDRSATGGGDGWHMSANDLVWLMRQFHRGSTVVRPALADQMLNRGFGFDWVEKTPAGTIYGKNGRWSNGANQLEQSTVFFLPHGQYVVVLANSPITAADQSLIKLVRDAFVAHLVPVDDHSRIDVNRPPFRLGDDHTRIELDPPPIRLDERDHIRIGPRLRDHLNP